jgi:hypothetical protein
MSRDASRWEDVLSSVEEVFTAPSFVLFCEFMGAWALVTARHTICSMVQVMDPSTRRAHDAYHRFVRAGAWSLDAAMAAVVRLALRLVASDQLTLYLDDTLFHRPGPKVHGAGTWRDAVRSSGRHVVYARGLNLVVICLRVDPPWGGMPLALPISVWPHAKGGMTMPELAVEMMGELAVQLPEATFTLCADGAYATLAGAGIERTLVVSRMRRDAALYEPAPAKTGKRGRPRTRGKRLPTPQQRAKALKAKDFTKVDCEYRGHTKTKLVWTAPVLWHRVSANAMVRLVIVRDPEHKEPDDFFFTTDLEMSAAEVLSVYAGRWGIEITYHDVKQIIGGQEPQSWKGDGPERAAGLSFWLYSMVWIWYLGVCGKRPRFTVTPWFASKSTPSFADALAELRRTLWHERISPVSSGAPLSAQTVKLLVDTLARAA